MAFTSILRTVLLASILFVATVTLSFAKQFETFDGRMYNGLYYPRIDIIEWGTPPHLEFHIYSKDKPIDLAAISGEKNGRPVLWLNYNLTFRNENICRHVIAPAQFGDGDKLYTYKDISPRDFDIIYVSTHPMAADAKLMNYTLKPYDICNDEMASNKPDFNSTTRMPASDAPKAEATTTPTPVAAPAKDEKTDGKDIGVDYENAAVPFSF